MSRATKEAKRSFVPEVRKLKNHRQGLYKLIFSLPFLLTFVAVFGRCLSVIVSVSPLCFEGALFRTALFKTAFLYCVRYFLLLPHFVHFALPSASIYSLLAPGVAMRYFSWFLRGGVLAIMHRRCISHLRSKYIAP